MRSLLIGGAGFIGSHLARRLVAEGHEVVVADDLSRGRIDDLKDLPITFQWVNVTQKEWQVPLVGIWDWVFCLAAVVGVPNVEKDPHRTLAVGTGATLGALSPFIQTRKFFFASTSEAYGNPAQIPTPETSPLSVPDTTSARSTYAISKLWGEAMVAQSGRPYVIARFHNVYGPRMGTDHVIPKFCLQLKAGLDPVKVHDPDAVRAFCYVEDAVEAVVRLMRLPTNSHVVNIGNPLEPISMWNLMSRLIAIVTREFDREHTLIQVPFRHKEAPIRRRIPDITRLQELTGWAPKVILDEGLARTWAWYRQ